MRSGNCFYLVVSEWCLPTETGHAFVEECELCEAAMQRCKECADAELNNFQFGWKIDCNPVTRCDDGYVITPKNGLDPYFYAVRAIEVERFGLNDNE